MEDKEKKEAETLPVFEAKLKENKIDLDPSNFDKYTTVRFLRARKYDIEAAYTMLTNHLKWREENAVDEILETAPTSNKNFKNLDRYWPGLYAGVDKDGVPIWVDRGGQIDADGLLASVPIEDIVNYHIYATEKTMRLKKDISEKLGKNCYAGVVIEDLEGFGRQHMGSNCIEIFKKINAINEANYPECLKVFFAINSPTLVSVAYKIVKSFIDPETRKKIFVIGNKYQTDLAQYIEDKQLLKEYGGKNEEVKLKGGGKYSDLKQDGTTYNPANVTISAGGTLVAPVTVKAKYKGNKISYSFTGNGDFKFGIEYKGIDGKGKKEAVLELKMYDPYTNGEVKGEITADKEGVYAFTFDNTHTWVKSRTIKYHFIISKPKKKEEEEEEEGGEEKGEKKKKKKKKKKQSEKSG